MTEIQPVFDYAALQEEVRNVVKDRTAEIHSLMRITAQSIVKIGRKLADVKPLLSSQFVAWLKCEFTWSERTAYNFIKVYERFGDESSTSNFAPSALYLLSAPSVPEETRQSAIKLAAAGETVTHKTAKRLIMHYVGRSDKASKEVKAKGFSEYLADEPEIKDSPAIFYVNRLTMAIQNGNLNLREDRLTYALHSLADLIKERVPLHPPKF